MEPDLRYCTTADGVTIAYAATGRGEQVLLHTSNDLAASLHPGMAARHEALAMLRDSFTVVQYDSRGTGLSQRECEDISPLALVRDIAAVADAIGTQPIVLFGYMGGMFAAVSYAAAHPGRVSQLVLWAPPWLDLNTRQSASLGSLAVVDWETFTETYSHLAMGWARGEQSRAYARVMRDTVTRETWLRFMSGWARNQDAVAQEYEVEARAIAVPTLVMQRRNYDSYHRVAGIIPGAKTRMFEGEGTGPYVGDRSNVRVILQAIAEFAGAPDIGADPAPSPEHSHAAIILFTDIADSTALTERLGDSAFRAASRALDAATREAMSDAGGSPVDGKVLGDGVMAVFASATQAIDAARRCAVISAESELRLHIGLHAGDVIREEGNVYGGAVNIASRICALCEPGEIMVSQTVRDMARTSGGVIFEDRGEHALKGIDDPVRVFAVLANDR